MYRFSRGIYRRLVSTVVPSWQPILGSQLKPRPLFRACITHISRCRSTRRKCRGFISFLFIFFRYSFSFLSFPLTPDSLQAAHSSRLHLRRSQSRCYSFPRSRAFIFVFDSFCFLFCISIENPDTWFVKLSER